MSRLSRWLDEEVELLREYDPEMTPEREVEYRKAMGKTLKAAQLKLADDTEALARTTFHPDPEGLADAVYEDVKSYSDVARDRGIRAFFRRYW